MLPLVGEISPQDRKVHCQHGKCPQYAQFAISVPTKQLKLCSVHIAELVKGLMEWKWLRGVAETVIREKGF